VAQIAMIKDQLVIEEKWTTIESFNRILAVYQILPGPEATELCCYFGYLSRGRIGSIIAGLGFILPGFLLMLLFSWLYTAYGMKNIYVMASFKGIQPIVSSMVFRAVHRIADHAFIDHTHEWNDWLLVLAVISGIQAVMGIPFFVTLFMCGFIFALLEVNISFRAKIIARLGAAAVLLLTFGGYILYVALTGSTPSLAIATGITIPNTWYYIFLLGLLAGLLTFGGAYTAIPFVQQIAVLNGHWLTNTQFLDSIAVGSVLPSPLVIFTTFVGFVSGGIVGSLLMTLGMFIPAFSFTLVGHNLFEKLVNIKQINAFLCGVTGSVVGLIAISAVELLRSSVINVYAAVLFSTALFAQYTFKHKHTSVLIVIASACAGQVLYLDVPQQS
jgi:putative chromate ion transporter